MFSIIWATYADLPYNSILCYLGSMVVADRSGGTFCAIQVPGC